jgi:hypothetical protein
MQDDQNDFNPMIPIILQSERGRDLTFITNHNNNYYGNQQFNPMASMRDIQMLEMNRCLIEANALLLEQRKVNAVLLKASLQQLKDGSNQNNLQIENKEAVADGEIKQIDMDVEFVVEDSAVPEKTIINKEKEKMMEVGSELEEKTLQRIKAIKESVEKQIKSNDVPPYYIESNIAGNTPGGVISAPVIFTPRTNIWRDRVRYIMKEMYYNEKTNSFRRKENQENDLSAVVVLYNTKITPVEIVVISQMKMKDFLDKDIDLSGVHISPNSTTHTSMNKLVNIVSKAFALGLRYYYQTAEPVITGDTAKVLIREGDDGFMADIVRLKPVFSFSKTEQIYSLGTYRNSVFKVSIVNFET